MKIYKVLVDKKPKDCLMCPLKASILATDHKCCKIDNSGGWNFSHFVPDNGCLLEENKK